ncbi:MAG: ABC transporter ATP-binding protein [Ignavibacteriales bacterium]|nr:ABC transporter ATP-binding protein [Ignavibacteriales bacterium]
MIEINNLHKKFKEKKVLLGIDLTIETGKTIAIIGRSGCGKSVLIKHIVGLLFPDEGFVKVDNQNISELSRNDLFAVRRKFGFLFQGAALFDSMTVGENVALPIVENNHDIAEPDVKKIVEHKLNLVGLSNIQGLKPSELSGGMKKRVGLARALVTDPDYILYDEPTTGLDPIMSDSIDDLIKELNTKLKVTSIVVTHDIVTVRNVADKVAMIHDGKIYFEGTPEQMLNSNDRVIDNFIKRTGF